MVKDENAGVSNPGETGTKIPLCPSHKHPSRACFLLDGMAAQQTEAQPVRGERCHAIVFERQPGAVSLLFVWLDKINDKRIYCIESLITFWVIKSDFLLSVSNFCLIGDENFIW